MNFKPVLRQVKSYLPFKVAKNKLAQPIIKAKPPSGVTGPRMCTAVKPVISLVAKRYKEPENNNMPIVKAKYDKLINVFFAREKVARKSNASV